MAGSGGDWSIDADGCISVGEPANGITYHPTLNIILILTKEPAIKVLDINSGTLLQKSTLSAVPKSVVKCAYLPNQDKILITDGRAVGLRRDHGGVLLLDTILQTSVNKTTDVVKIELPLSEAVQFLKCLQSTDLPVADNVADIIKFLEKEISRCQFLPKNKHKSIKWSTVCLEFTHSYLKCVSSSLVHELKRLNKFVPALPIASAISERLNTLLNETQAETGSSTTTVDRSLMFSEAARRETFGKWPHMNYKWALPDQMAQAGFYHQPNSTGDDRAMCFTCNVCLVCWEPTDEPWSEHERHSPSCPFVKGEYTQNVPLAVTYATNPAVLIGGRQNEVFHIAPSSHSELIATYCSSGNIVIWDITRQLKKEVNFSISNNDGTTREKTIPKCLRDENEDKSSDSDSELSELSQRCNLSSNVETLIGEDMELPENNLTDIFSSLLLPKPIILTSVCVLGVPKVYSNVDGTNIIRPCIVAGVSLKQDTNSFDSSSSSRTHDTDNNPPLVQVLNDVNNASNREKSLNIMHLENDNDTSSIPCLLIYDITRQTVGNGQKRPSIAPVSKKVNSSNGTQQKSSTSYGNFSELLYDICDDALDPMCSLNIVDVGPLESFANSTDLKFGGPSSSSDLQNSDMGLVPSSTTSFIEQQNIQIEVREKFHSTGLISQYIELPKCFQTKSFYINSVTPTTDGKFILVTVSHQSCKSCENEATSNPSPKDMIINHRINNPSLMKSENNVESNIARNKTQVSEECFGGCLLYRLNFNTECITVEEEPFMTYLEHKKTDCVKHLLLLPQDVTNSGSISSSSTGGPAGYFVTVTYGNQLRLHSLNTFEILAETSTLAEEIVSVIYCTSIEKLCACSVQGNLLFFNLVHTQTYSYAEDMIESILQPEHLLEDGILDPGSNKDQIDSDGGIPELFIQQPLTSSVLLSMHELVQFENLTPRFAANMPPCWTEIQQEQKQRRHPQHLQQQGEAMQHTRSWRLQNDSNTWDEHLFEITLPKLCCIGHIDFKFNLHPICTSPPNVQITLLKQNTTGIGKLNNKNIIHDNVDDPVDFNTFVPNDIPSDLGPTLNGIRYLNPVTSKSFLDAHNAEIICGPLDLCSNVDLSGQSGVVTLTSPELFNFSCRSFLIHLKALPNERDQNHKPDQVLSSKSVPSTSKSSLSRHFVVKIKDKYGGVPSLQSMLEYFAPPGSAVDRLAATAPNKKITNLKGCDWFHEISITIRKTKETSIQCERLQRAAMLRSTGFHEKLIDIICGKDSPRMVSPEYHQHMALDILIWIAAIQMHKRVNSTQHTLVFFTIQSKLENLIENCFIKGTRTVAHKCSKLIVICLEHAKIMKNQEASPIFNFALLQALLEWLPKIPLCHSAGALRWFFLLLNRVKCLDLASIGQKCVDLLVSIAKQYNEQNNPLHSLLRSRFGLYGIPFEPELFDIEPSPCLKPQSTPISYASVVSTSSTTAIGANNSADVFSPNEELDLRDLLNMNVHERSSGGRSLYSFPGHYLRGLLEVEPLHFTCHAASDGTKMEKIDTGTNSGIISNATLPGSVFDHIPSHLHSNNGFSTWTGSLSTLFTTLKKKQEEFLKLQQQHKRLEQTLAETILTPQVDITPMNINHGFDFYPKTLSGSGTIMVSTASANSAFSYQGSKAPASSSSVPNSLHVEKIYAGTGESEHKTKCNGKNQTDSKKDSVNPYTNFLLSPWQQLLQSPPQQVLVIERMHSGARRFVVLDFGKNILLTDLMIPACSDLVSLSIDIWKQAEEVDGQRLVVTTDIGVRSLVMSDLQPPPVCRFLKITTIGRYGMSTTRCRIPIGMFYGHTFILPWEHGKQSIEIADQEEQENQIQPQLNALSSLLEDIHCRYSLACDKLFNFLMPLIPTEPYNSNQTYFYLQRDKDKMSEEDQRIIAAYQECLQLQLQLNLITHAMARLDRAQVWLEGTSSDSKIKSSEPLNNDTEIKICTDKLRTLIECLLGVLLGLTYPTPSIPQLPSGLYLVFDQNICETLLRFLCVNGSRRMQLSCSILLVRMCGMQPWWGKFIAKMLVTLYSSKQSLLFPQDRIFILLTYLGQKSIASNSSSSVLQSVIGLLEQLLKPLVNRDTDFVRGILDLPLIGWVLLFLSVCLDNASVPHQSGSEENDMNKASGSRDKDSGVVSNRWDFIHGEVAMLRNRSNNLKSSATRLYRRKLQKRLMHHKQQLEDLEQAKKNFFASTEAMTAIHSQFRNKNSSPSAIKDLEAVVKQHEKLFKKTFKQHTAKHFKDIIQIRRNSSGLVIKSGTSQTAGASSTERDDGENEKDILPPLTQNQCLPVVKGLTSLLLAMDFTCNVDMFLLACKVLARIATSTRPAINLGEAFTQEQLRKLIQLCVGNENQAASSPWGGPWASHAIICLLQDILEGERLYPCSMSHENSPAEDDLVTLTTETDDSLQEASSFPMGDEVDSVPVGGQAESPLKFKDLLGIIDSDDSESDDCNLDIFESSNVAKKTPFGPLKKSWTGIYNVIKNAKMAGKENKSPDLISVSNTNAGHTVSTAVDARLEYGLEMNAELRLKVMMALEADILSNAIVAPLQPLPEGALQEYSTEEEETKIKNNLYADISSSFQLNLASSVDMLSLCFNQIFSQLQVLQVNLESLLQLWLSLTEEASNDTSGVISFEPAIVPTIPLNAAAISGLLSALAWYPTVSLRTWCLAFQSLTILSNLKPAPVSVLGQDTQGSSFANASLHRSQGIESNQDDLNQGWMTFNIVNDSNLLPVLMKFLSGTRLDNTIGIINNNVGPTVTRALHNFLVRLQFRCDVVSPSSRLGLHLKDLMLKLVYTLITVGGAIQSCQGPLDAQCKLFESLLNLRFDGLDSTIAVNVIVATVTLIHNYIANSEKVFCRSSTETGVNAASCFGGLFASVLRGENNSSAASCGNRDTLICRLLKLVTSLLQIPMNSANVRNSSHSGRNIMHSATTSFPSVSSDLNFIVEESLTDNSKIEQSTLGSCLLPRNGETDEHKTAAATTFSTSHSQQKCHHANLGMNKTIYIADSILQHEPTMLRLLTSLANCSGSTMAMLLGVSGLNTVPPMDANERFVLGEPISVGDSIFQLLCTLNAKASSIHLILQALFSYISNSNSSEQLLFSGLPIVPRLSEPLLWFILRVLDCETALTEFLQMGGMHVLCKNLVHSNQQLINSYPSFISTIMQHLNNGYTNQTTKRQGSDLDTVDGLLNFAPLGTITSSNPTAQPAEILIQAAPPHRRARTPAWSYHFYPDESWVDLTISLPCAILLKEIQIQPHLTSLATCPSAVSVEICRDGASGATPLCPPQSTNGLTFIRLQLTQPEIAMTVTLRLHKPRDSSNIGLSQVLLLGSTTFGEAAAKSRAASMPSEDSVSRSSLGWLRIIHHCLTLPVGFPVQQQVCDAAVSIPNFLQACCTLLLTPNLGVYMAHIEHVLLQLGLHSTEVGLTEINTLLHNTGWTHTNDNLQVPITSSALDSVVEIIYQLCTTDDSSTKIRVEAVLIWLKETATKALQEHSSRRDENHVNKAITNPPIAYIHCVASILWTLHESSVSFSLSSLLKIDLTHSLLQWSMILSVKSAMKRAVDQILCSVCHIQPDTFTYVLECMDVLTVTSPVPGPSNSNSNSSKHQSTLTDDYKEVEVEHPHIQKFFRVNLNESQLTSLAIICQSSTAIHHLLKSGLPFALIHKILDFCTGETKDTHAKGLNTCMEDVKVLNHSVKFINVQRGGGKSSFKSSELKNFNRFQEGNSSGQTTSSTNGNFWFNENHLNSEGSLTDADKASCPSWHNNIHITGYNDPVTPEFVAAALNFFTELCNENVMQNWLGGSEGSSFWLPLLHILCSSDSHYVPQSVTGKESKKLKLTNHQRSVLEMATLRFLSHCCWTHQANQQLLSQVLCDVIRHQGNHHLGAGLIHVISGFTRRLLLQLLLENEKILVFIRSQQTLPKSNLGTPSSLPQHPRFGCGHNFRLLYLNLQMTCSDIIKNISGIIRIQPAVENKEEKDLNRKDMAEIGLELVDHLSMAAGVTAKDKRQRDSKTNATERSSSARNIGSMESNMNSNSLVLPTFVLTHDLFPGQSLPGNMSLGQLLALIKMKNSNVTHITLNLVQIRKSREMKDTNGHKVSLSDMLVAECTPLPTTLQVFASMGGLALLAQHLPLLYPEITRLSSPVIRPLNADRISNDLGNILDSDWVKVESTDDINDDFLELIPPGAASPQSTQSSQVPPPSIPPHSLAAFGLFLRLPGYAEVLLKEWKKAQCLLRLALGITDNGEGGDIFQSSVATSLPTLPFQVLQQLFDSTPLTTDDGMLLRRMTLEVGAIHLLLACLAVLSHQSEDINLPGLQNEPKCQQLFIAAAKAGKSPQETVGKSDNKSHLYWAKGTGFGTGSTDQSWDVEQAILRQRSEEEHVTCLLQVLASYINPGGHVPQVLLSGEEVKDDSDMVLTLLPPMFPELLSQSCLLPAISSYLRNDSVLDMARHVPLYRALLQLLRALAVSHQLVNLLLPIDGSDASMSICCLLTKMKSCVDVYASKLKSNKGKGNKNSGKSSSKSKEEDEENEGLAQLIPDIQETARIVQAATERLILEDEMDNKNGDKYSDNSCTSNMSSSLEERYINAMRPLQFDTFEMIVEDDDAIRFTVSHHFESNLRAAGDHSHPSRARRLAQEAVTLSTSLPLSYSSSVFVRCDQDRLDLMKVLITGPAETPYANGCFEFDVYFPPDYPNSPMLINLETTGHHTVRFNPNLYNDGKVCLSVLNTWHGRPEEKWNPQTSSFLQVLVSIQSLILVQEPYFNEPGYERSRGTPSGTQSSREYDSNIRLATVKWAMLEQIRNPCPCFKEVIHKHFWMKRSEIIKQIETWISEMDAQSSDRRTGRTIALNSVALKHHLAQLKEEFVKMKPPAGLEDMKDLFDVNKTQLTPSAISGNSSFNNSAVESSSQDSPDSNDTSVGPV